MLIVFDIDGTLADSIKLFKDRDHAHVERIAAKYSVPREEAHRLLQETKDRNKKVGKYSTLDAMLSLGITEQEFYDIMNSVAVTDDNVSPIPHVVEVVRDLALDNLLVTLSASPYDASLATLRQVGINSYFRAYYCPDTHRFIKPSVEINQRILADFQCTDGYSVGDSVEKDLLPAKEAGFTTVLYAPHQPSRIQPFHGVDYVVGELREMIQVIRKNQRL